MQLDTETHYILLKTSVSKKDKAACTDNLNDFKVACGAMIEDFDTFVSEH